MFEKRGKWMLISFLVIIIIFLILIILYLFFFHKNYDSLYNERITNNQLVNPLGNYSEEEAINLFNEDFVYYILYIIKAYNLHNPLLSSDTPKLEFIIDDLIFNAEIVKGEIMVDSGSIDKKDIQIRTTKKEAINMLKDEAYVSVSFEEGKSAIELVSGKAILFEKGYLSLYTELTGKSITGDLIKKL